MIFSVVRGTGSTKKLNFVEVKDYLTQNPGESQKKSSGWRALKSVVQWWDTTIEIQVWDVGCRVWDVGCRVYGVGCRVNGVGCRL